LGWLVIAGFPSGRLTSSNVATRCFPPKTPIQPRRLHRIRGRYAALSTSVRCAYFQRRTRIRQVLLPFSKTPEEEGKDPAAVKLPAEGICLAPPTRLDRQRSFVRDVPAANGPRRFEVTSLTLYNRRRPVDFRYASLARPSISSIVLQPSKLPCGFQFQDLQSHGGNLVSATSADQQPSSDHLMRSLLATNRVAAAGVVEPASSVDKVSV